MDRRTFTKAGLASVAGLALPRIALAQQRPTTFRWVPHADVAILDPTFTTASITGIHGLLVFDTLYGLDGNYQPQPQMASGHETSADGLVWKIKLRNGLKFHDGSPVRAQDAVASIKRWWERDVVGALVREATKELSALDDNTVQFTLKEPCPILLAGLGRQVGSQACIMPERLASLPTNKPVPEAIGSGPFHFKSSEWVSGSRVVYEKFADYIPRSSGAPAFTAGPKVAHVDRVEFHIVADKATAVAALQNDEIDGIEVLESDFVEILRQDPNIQIVKRDLPTTAILRMNHLYAPFNNPEIRRIVLEAVDQTEYMSAMFGTSMRDFWIDRCGYFAPNTPLASAAGMEIIDKRRPISALREALKAAGYKGEKVVIIDPADYATYHSSALVTADLFRRLGMTVDVQAMDWNTAVQRRNSQASPDSGGWHVAFTGLSVTNTLDPIANNALRTNGRSAWFGWPDIPQIEQLRQEFIRTSDPEAQKRICRDLQVAAYREVPYVVLGGSHPISAYRKGWSGIQRQIPIFYSLNKA